MNPSVYPVTTATWRHMLALLPELKTAYHTVTFNRNDKNFTWKEETDKALLKKLSAIGMILYAGEFETIPRQAKSEELNFGATYLGQTVKLSDGLFKFDGMWGGGKGNDGQFGIYTGRGDTLPDNARYLSFVLADPNILTGVEERLARVNTLEDAMALSPRERRFILTTIDNRISMNPRLARADDAGKTIEHTLTH